MILPTKVYLYLHGFASSPQSMKARYLADRFHSAGIKLIIPDLNQEDFYHLTLSRQIHQVEELLPSNTPVTLIGSSFGGLTAAWLGERNLQVDRLILLAPAFQFLKHWIPKLGNEQMQRWQTEQSLMTYHYGKAEMLPIGYSFVTDLASYDETNIQRPVPTLILHGQHDEVIPIQASRDFAAQRPWVTLIELDSDHSLGNVQPDIWQAIQAFALSCFALQSWNQIIDQR
jgi:pimeloyl-ACP methyl ester carboxylesterase